MAKTKNKTPVNPWILTLATGLILFPLGFVAGRLTDDTNKSNESVKMADAHDHDSDDHSTADHDHSTDTHSHSSFEVAASQAPSISNLRVVKDKKSGWNLSFDVAAFVFDPANASNVHVGGHGHAHLYIDGKKVTRLYASDHYINELEAGTHTFKVTLNTNDHQEYVVDGVVVGTEATIVVSE